MAVIKVHVETLMHQFVQSFSTVLSQRYQILETRISEFQPLVDKYTLGEFFS